MHQGLCSLAKPRAPLLRARPRTWGEVSVALVADLAGTQITGTADFQLSRANLEKLAVDRLLQLFQGHIHAMSLPRYPQDLQCYGVEFCFGETPEAEANQIATVDDQRVTLPASLHEPAMTLPVRLGRGSSFCPTLLQLVVHGLPARLCRQGLGHTILRCAGYSETECRVEGDRV